jgi:NNP family nitrate/nitrite transporter-like MFS transporter
MIEPPASALTEKNRPVLMMALLVVAVFFSMMGRVVFSPLMPALQTDLGFTLTTAGTLFMFVSISYSVSMLCSGFLSARIGHDRTIVVSLAGITVGFGLSALSTSVVTLAAGMICIGTGSGIYPPSGLVMINTKISAARRSTAYAFHEIGPNMAMLLAPLLVLMAGPWIGWRGVLFLMTGLCGLATLSFYWWGQVGSGLGTAPNLSDVGTILRLRTTWVGMLVLSAGLVGWQGVYAMLPAYLVSHELGTEQYVNSLLTLSRVASVLMLLVAGFIIRRLGKRRAIVSVLAFSGLFTGLIGLVEGPVLALVVVAQPAFQAVMFPAMLASMADIGDSRYQNITFALIITVGISVGTGLAPALLGMSGDYGVGWLGFVGMSGYMLIAIVVLIITPAFGRE